MLVFLVIIGSRNGSSSFNDCLLFSFNSGMVHYWWLRLEGTPFLLQAL
jgi:hypothetical protein